MSRRDDDLRVRPGRIRSRGDGPSPKSFVAQVLKATQKAGHLNRAGAAGSGRRRSFGRGRAAAITASLRDPSRRVVVKARVVRHRGPRFRSAPLSAHLNYLARDGVTREGGRGVMFDAGSDAVDGSEFATRCEHDRHHFRFVVSPEDAGEMTDLKAFTRDLAGDMERDLGTKLDWVAVEHHNTDNPHVHLLVRGRAARGSDLVIAPDYIGRGLRARAEALVSLELGPKSELELRSSLERDVGAERWTRLDQAIRRAADRETGTVDLQPGGPGDADPATRRLMVGRMQKLETLGLARPAGAAQWEISPDTQSVLQDLGARNDVIRTMHRAAADRGLERSAESYVAHGTADPSPERVVGRVLDRGLADELKGTAYLVVDGTDGRIHHTVLPDLADLERAPRPGGVVELRGHQDEAGRCRLRVWALSDLSVEGQVTAGGATWLDRELVGREKSTLAQTGFGAEVRDALSARTEHLTEQGLARRQATRMVFASDLLNTLRERELTGAAASIARETGRARQLPSEGEQVAGVYRRRVDLASGRFALIDDALGGKQFALVPWRPDLERNLGRDVSGVVRAGGAVDWAMARGQGPSV